MSTHGAAQTPGMAGAETDVRRRRRVDHRHTRTETKAAFKTTEMIAFVAVLASILIAAAIADTFDASQAWLYATILTTGYMISRGLAKSGSPEPRDDDG
jgi:hypothetical protein